MKKQGKSAKKQGKCWAVFIQVKILTRVRLIKIFPLNEMEIALFEDQVIVVLRPHGTPKFTIGKKILLKAYGNG